MFATGDAAQEGTVEQGSQRGEDEPLRHVTEVWAAVEGRQRHRVGEHGQARLAIPLELEPHIGHVGPIGQVVALIEAPDDQAMAAGALIVGSSGAFSGGSTTKLMTSGEAMKAMAKAQSAAGTYKPATG